MARIAPYCRRLKGVGPPLSMNRRRSSSRSAAVARRAACPAPSPPRAPSATPPRRDARHDPPDDRRLRALARARAAPPTLVPYPAPLMIATKRPSQAACSGSNPSISHTPATVGRTGTAPSSSVMPTRAPPANSLSTAASPPRVGSQRLHVGAARQQRLDQAVQGRTVAGQRRLHREAGARGQYGRAVVVDRARNQHGVARSNARHAQSAPFRNHAQPAGVDIDSVGRARPLLCRRSPRHAGLARRVASIEQSTRWKSASGQLEHERH